MCFCWCYVVIALHLCRKVQHSLDAYVLVCMRVALKCKGLHAAVSSWSCGLVVCAVHAHAHMQSVVPPPPPQQRSRSPVRRSSSRSSWIEYIVRRLSNQHQSDKRPPSFRFATPVRVWHIQCASGGAVYPITPPPPSPRFGERSVSANVNISSQDNLPYRVTFLCRRALHSARIRNSRLGDPRLCGPATISMGVCVYR